MTALGIDLSAQAAKTWACTVAWSDDGAIATIRFHPRQTDAELLALMEAADATGIDAPFGWPRAFLDAMEAYRHSGRWVDGQDVVGDSGWSGRLRLRDTDRVVRSRVPVTPLSVSADSLAVCAFRAAGLLARRSAASGLPLDRAGGATGLYEVYPAAALAAWGLPYRGYKAPRTGLAVREAIADRLREALGSPLPEPEWEQARGEMLAADHALDAFVSALVARLAVLGATHTPDRDQEEAAVEEGWIHLPLPGSLTSRFAAP